ncbi:MAG: YegP family protein [Muriicola sp.]|nr:YegP family protein [Muriicola sp.]MBT8282949.1 YegP family protein [Muriicola sp.]NNK12005.1 YegP family protein [Flavobacteriaceae bacterium]
MIEVKKDNKNLYSFVVTAKGGNSILQSVSFASKEELDATLEKLPPLVSKPYVFERKTSHTGKFHFTLKDQNGRTIGTSKEYTSEAGMENGIVNFRNRISAIDQS